MKKKIFFLLSSMNVGGVEKAFLGISSIIPKDDYEIHLGLLQEKGGFLDFLPDHVIVHKINCYDKYWNYINDPPLKTILFLFKKREYIKSIIHFFLYIIFKCTSSRYLFYKYLLKDEPSFPISFDIAIAFAGPSQAIDYYVCKKINATQKIGWIHFDITKFGIDKGLTNKLYSSYSKICIVSHSAKTKFDQLFPKHKHKTKVFYNVIPEEQILKLSQLNLTHSYSSNYINILTVGRMSYEKGQDLTLYAIKILINKGYNIKWYYIGEGSLLTECQKIAKDLNITKHTCFLGTLTNPYPYMKKCDIYVQPSRHEGFCITLAEARLFTNPIVTTNFTGAYEQLKTRSNAIIVETSPLEIAKGIEQALTLPPLKSKDIIKETNISDLFI